MVIDARKAAAGITVRVQMKNLFWVKMGMVFIRIGCFLSGAQYVDEFPMSLIQPEDGERNDEKRVIRHE
jgi:hypothetical protein